MNGLEVVQAADGQQAVDVFSKAAVGSIDMVLMDMQMPELDGCAATQAIRKLQRADAAAVPIVALTGNAGSEDVEHALQSGMNDFMTKPIKMKALAKVLSKYLG